ncbi:MAG: leucyl aminopeptidase [Candidatus Aenigmatarchaeota archaeon]
MRIEISSLGPTQWAGEALATGVFKEDSDRFGAMDIRMDGEIRKLFSRGMFEGDWKQTYMLDTHGKLDCERLLLIGLGERSKFDLARLRKASALVTRFLKEAGISNFATDLHGTGPGSTEERAQAVTEGMMLGNYRFTRKHEEKPKGIVSAVLLERNDMNRVRRGIESGEVIAESVNRTRNLVNGPAGEVTADFLAGEAAKLANRYGLKITVIGKSEMELLGMNAILAVNKGSASDPKFVILEWDGGGRTVAVVGKGITFDSGGLNLKNTPNIKDMKSDMAGAAVVIGLMEAAARLRLPVRLIGAFVATDNMPGPNATRPGDIITAYNGKTIEVVNTDAEGRLILADALSYVEKNYRPSAIIDIATLTAACVVALGHHAAGMLGTDEKLAEMMTAAGRKTGERVWQLPLWDEYREMVKGDLTDMVNSGKEDVLGPGAITGAAFLSNFVEGTPWAHLDIAGTAWVPMVTELHPKGATGWGVRLLIELLRNY